VKGLRVSHGADGKTRLTASIPGNGISYQETFKHNNSTTKATYENSRVDDHTMQRHSSDANARTPFFTIQGEYIGSREDGVFDPAIRELQNKTCKILFFQDEVSVNFNNMAYVREYYSIHEVEVNASLVEKKGFFSRGMDCILLIGLDRQPHGLTVLEIKLSSNSIVPDLLAAIQEQKELALLNPVQDFHFDDEDDFNFTESESDSMVGIIYEIGEISENQVAVAVLLEEGTVSTGDEVHMGVNDDIIIVTVAAIVSDGQLIGQATPAHGGVTLVFHVGIERIEFLEYGGIISNSIHSFL
jgi:hypothetical protein